MVAFAFERVLAGEMRATFDYYIAKTVTGESGR